MATFPSISGKFRRTLVILGSFLTLGFVIFLLSGGLALPLGSQCADSGLVIGPPAPRTICQGDYNRQTLHETFLVSLLFSVGIFGLFAMMMSVRSVYAPGRAFGFLDDWRTAADRIHEHYLPFPPCRQDRVSIPLTGLGGFRSKGSKFGPLAGHIGLNPDRQRDSELKETHQALRQL